MVALFAKKTADQLESIRDLNGGVQDVAFSHDIGITRRLLFHIAGRLNTKALLVCSASELAR